MKLRSIFVVMVVSLYNLSYAQEMDDLDAEFAALDAELDMEFDHQDEQLELAFQQVKLAVERAYEGLTEKIQVNWGEDVVLPQKTTWTTYNDDFSTRVSFDFELGVYRVETIVTDDVAKSLLQLKQMAGQIAQSSPDQLRQQDVLYQSVNNELEKQVLHTPKLTGLLVSAHIATDHVDVKKVLSDNVLNLINKVELDQVKQPYSPLVPQKAALPDSAVPLEDDAEMAMQSPPFELVEPVQASIEQPLEAQAPIVNMAANEDIKLFPTHKFAGRKQPRAEVENVIELVTKVVATKPSIELQENPKDGRKKLVLTIPFVNDYHKVLMDTLLDTVKDFAKEYRIDVSLIMAIIETESSFNPMATSPIPAFGLMQLVPNSGAVDAYHFVYGEKKVVTPKYLYNQVNNLRLGTAYLHLLSNRYLGRINDPQSRLYCILASYNIGIGNLANTLVGKKSIRQAVRKANTMHPGQLYDFLHDKLPAEETRNYLVKVLHRKSKYSYLDDINN